MILFLYTLIAIVVAFGGGFLLGKRAEKKETYQNAPRFGRFEPGSEDTKEASEKGRKAVQARITKRKVRIMERARREGKITNDDVEDLFCISDSTARNYLNELEKEGKLTQIGNSGRGVHYILSK